MANEAGKDPTPEKVVQGSEEDSALIEAIKGLMVGIKGLVRDLKGVKGLREDLKHLAASTREQRLQEAARRYKKPGTMVPFIDGLEEYTMEEKAEFYDDAMVRAKGQKPKTNPYRRSGGFIKLGALALMLIAGAAMIFAPMAFGDQKKYTVFPGNAFPNGVSVRGLAILNSHAGNVFWVDSGKGSNGYKGTRLRPFATVDYCIGRATADKGDICLVAPGHAESGSDADLFDVDVAGVAIVGIGTGADSPSFTFSDTGTTIAIGAANVTLHNLRMIAGKSGVVIGIAVEDAGDEATISNIVWPEPTTTSWEFVDAIDLESGVVGLTVIGNTYYNIDTTGAAHFIEMGNGVNTDIKILDNLIYGEFSVSAIWSNDADLEILVAGNTITNATNGEHAIEFATGASTGVIRDNLVRTDAQGTAIDPGSMTMANNCWDDDTTADTVCIPVVAGGEASQALIDVDLDHLINTAAGTDVYPVPLATDSIIAMMMAKGAAATPSTFNNTTDSQEAIRDVIDTNNTADQVDLDAILADTDTISGITLPVAPVANSLAAFIASGGTALGTELGDSQSLVDVLGNDGTGTSRTGDLDAADLQSRIDAISAAMGIVAAAAADGFEEDGTGGDIYDMINSTDANLNFFSGDGQTNFDDNLFSFLVELSKYVVDGDGDFAAGTALASNNSLVDVLGSDGNSATFADALSVLGAIGTDEVASSTAFASTSVEPDADGSVLERLEAVQAAAAATADHPNYIALSVDLNSATWNTQAAHEILTVTGAINLKIMIEVTETLTDAADAATMILGDEITTNGMIVSTSVAGAGDANQLDSGELWVDATPTDVSPIATSTAILEFTVFQGADVGYTIGGSAVVDGTLIMHMWWYPLDSTGAAVVGAGGVL